jgi:LPS sulfotransferase NodH
LNEPGFDLPPSGMPCRDYLICSTPRSGSTLLAALLRGSGQMGVPHEYLNAGVHQPVLARRLDALAADGSVDFVRYLDALRRRRTSPNGVFGMKAHFSQLQPHLAFEPISRFVRGATLIRIRRRDRIAQAISLYRAMASGIWSIAAGGMAEPSPEIAYDGAAIGNCLSSIEAQEQGWDGFLATNSRLARDIWYEDLIASPDTVCREACKAVGVNPGIVFDLAQAGLTRLAPKSTDEWKLRYRAESGFEGG